MADKIVLVTAGGPISSFHAAMKEMHETLEQKAKGRFELWGAFGGLSGLVNARLLKINAEDIEEERAGSLIGADREIADTSKVIDVVSNNNIYAVVMMGGDNHLGEAEKLFKAGINIVGYPKTMDGDLSSFITLGWESAVKNGAEAVRNHHNTAITTKRVFYVGLFGRNTDWVPCAVSLYGGGDRCIPCEKEYDWEYIIDKIANSVKANQEKYRVNFAVVPYSEGARIKGMNPPPEEHCDYDKHKQPKLQPEWVGMELVRLSKKSGFKACFQAYTYSMRDFPPTKTDIKLSKMAGKECINMILEGDFGKAIIFKPFEKQNFYIASRAPLKQAAVQRKLIDTGYFNYEELEPNKPFVNDYGNLFRDSLGSPPSKDELVYKNMLGSKTT